MMGLIRAVYRLILIVPLAIIGLMLAVLLGPWLNHDRRLAIASWWHGWLLRILNIHVHVHGRPTLQHGLMVSNHISWLDIVVIGASYHTFFVSKAEVRSWPVIGWLARGAGTLFLKRGSGQAAMIREAMTERIQQQTFILFFPEGTTTEGVSIKSFHPRLFGAAIEAGESVQPVCLYYQHDPQPHPYVPYVDEQSFADNFKDLLTHQRVDVHVDVGEAINSEGQQRKPLAQKALAEVERLLEQMKALG